MPSKAVLMFSIYNFKSYILNGSFLHLCTGSKTFVLYPL